MDIIEDYYHNSDFSRFKDISLYIPTYNRNYYFSRCLWYHAHFPFGRIIVADSSQEDKKMINRESVEKIQKEYGANITYLEFEDKKDKFGREISEKWLESLKYINTPYYQACVDKEFLFPNTLLSLVKFLDEHQDYDSAEGMYLFAKEKGNDINFMRGHCNSFGNDERYSVNESNSLTRYLIAINNKYASINCMALRRTSNLMETSKLIKEYNFTDLRSYEIMLEVLTIVLSKLHYEADYPAHCRDLIQYTSHGIDNKKESSSLRYPTFDEYKECGIYDSLFNNMILCLTKIMKRDNPNIDESELSEIVKKSLTNILYRRDYFGSETNIMYKKIQNTHPILFKSYLHFARPILRKIMQNNQILTSDSISERLPDVEIMKKIFIKYKSYHDSDRPII